MSKIKLKPCPFCGCKNIKFWETDNDTNRFQIVCIQCFNGTDECISEEVAIEKWNTRTPMDNIVEKLEEEYVNCQKNMNLVKDEDGNEAGHIYDEYLNKSIAYETAINIVKQEINNGENNT